jgi:hypothetical protein
MDRTEQITFDVLELEFRLNRLLKRRKYLYLRGCNNEILNDKIREVQNKLRIV